jgi:Rrf2 family protein
MQITRQADYAVRAVLHLTGLGAGEHTSTAQIAREQKIPATFLAKIVSQLSAAGILRATRGAHGGVMLARPANDISLLEVVEAIDGPILLNECVIDPGLCPLGDTCAIQSVWCDAQAGLVRRLSQAKFGQLARPPDLPAAYNSIERV